MLSIAGRANRLWEFCRRARYWWSAQISTVDRTRVAGQGEVLWIQCAVFHLISVATIRSDYP